jgi:hypothetical protein
MIEAEPPFASAGKVDAATYGGLPASIKIGETVAEL